MNLFELIKEKQEKLLQKITGVESFGLLNNANGVPINPNGLTREQAELVLKNKEKYTAEWRTHNTNPNYIVLNKKLFYTLKERIPLTDMYEIRTLVNGKVELQVPAEHDILMRELGQLDWMARKPFELFKKRNGTHSAITSLIVYAIIIGIVIPYALPPHTLSWTKLILWALIASIVISIYRYWQCVLTTKKGNRLVALIARKWPKDRWNDLLFTSGVSKDFRVKYDGDIRKEPLTKELNDLMTFAIKQKGELVFFIHKLESNYAFNLTMSELTINGGITAAVVLDESILFQKNGHLTCTTLPTCDRVAKLNDLFSSSKASLLIT